MSDDGWETLSDDFWGDVPRLLRRWKTPQLGAFAFHEMFSFFQPFVYIGRHSISPIFLSCSERVSKA